MQRYEYPMNVTSLVQQFVHCVNGRVKPNGNELIFHLCPRCEGGTNHKDKNTFSINVRTGQFECKRSSCGYKGNLITLAEDFRDRGFDIGKELNVYYDVCNTRAQFKKFKDAHRAIEVRPKAIEYLKSRGISEEIVRKYEITSDPNDDNLIVFPFRDETGELVFVKYRYLDTERIEKFGKERSIKGNYKKILFGMSQCENFETLVITEGQIDSLSLAEAGIKNAVSVPLGKNTFTWRPFVWEWIIKFNEIVVFGDLEGDTVTLAKEIIAFFPKTVKVVQPEDYHGCKDANEILQLPDGKELLRKAVHDAKPNISLRIKNLARVENIDLDEMAYFSTGIKQLDAAIGHGFHEGELIILTGKCGEGKSTFASQIVAKMIKNGLKCFCYSGELPDYMFKAWIDKQVLSGREFTVDNRKKASEWYDEKCFLYDNSAIIDTNETITELSKQAIRDLGCKFILIDNLMTAMDSPQSDDLFRAQSDFVKKITQIAKGFDAIIMLVAHPRKNSSDDNDSISGSGDITNLANLVLRYERSRDKNGHIKDQNVSRIKITKNRTTGVLNNEGIIVEYDDKSMRIKEPQEKHEDFMETQVFEFAESDEADEIPF